MSLYTELFVRILPQIALLAVAATPLAGDRAGAAANPSDLAISFDKPATVAASPVKHRGSGRCSQLETCAHPLLNVTQGH
ncbi:MAG: hypothetical protein AAF289_05180 [Cyanobacteria bacterium P01_A01_bin.135]